MFQYIKFDLFLAQKLLETGAASREEIVRSQEEASVDLSHLSPEQREQVEKIQIRIEQLQQEIEVVNAGVSVVGTRREVLESRTDSEISFRELSEQWASDINERVILLRWELWELQEQKQILLRSIELAQVNTLSESEIKQMQVVTAKEFLSTPPAERLRFITKWNIDTKDVKEWWVTKLDFTFTFDGKFNRDLYLRTTAGQVLGENIRTVSVDGKEYSRIWLNGEFFSQEWKRLTIHEWTQLEILQFGTADEMKQIQDSFINQLKEFEWTPHEALAWEAIKKWYDPKFVISLFWEQIASVSFWKTEAIEDKLTDIARLQDDFSTDYPSQEALWENGKPSEKFAWYVTNALNPSKLSQVAELYGYNLDEIRQTRRRNNPSLWGGPMNLENINIEGISKEEVEAILNKQRFTPGSKDAQVLFMAACQAADLPKDWCNKESLHRILSKESNGVVGRLNYTIRWHSSESFKEQALSSSRNNPIGARSTASWLGQLLLSNVDIYYPDGRNGIWDSLNEAVWMLRYIKDRYGNPDIAWSVYGKVASYDHPQKGRQHKWFAEWY